MKEKNAILLAYVFVFAIYGVAFGDGGPRIQVPPPDPTQNPNVVGAYVKGYFTVAYDKTTPNQYTHHNIHVVLEWSTAQGKLKGRLKGKDTLYDSIDFKKRITGVAITTKPARPQREMHLFSTPVKEPTSKPLCEYNEDQLKLKYWDLPKDLGIPEAFGVQGAETYITKLKIIRKDFCGAPGTPLAQEPKAMIYGEVEIFLYKETAAK